MGCRILSKIFKNSCFDFKLVYLLKCYFQQNEVFVLICQFKGMKKKQRVCLLNIWERVFGVGLVWIRNIWVFIVIKYIFLKNIGFILQLFSVLKSKFVVCL